MLAVFFGNDEIEVRKEALGFVSKNKNQEQLVVKIEAGDCLNGQLVRLAESETLFGENPFYVLDGVLDAVDSAEIFFETLEIIAASKVRFVLIAKKISAEEKRNISKYTKEIFEFKKTTIAFNSFNLANAFLEKDKKKLWILLQEARKNKVSNEEIIGILWWQLKTLRLAKITNSAEEAGVKDFPYNKSKRALLKFKSDELEKSSLSLLNVYHDGHKGVRDMDIALEEWCLSLGM